MDQSYWMALAASSIACAVTTTGIIAVRRFEGWSKANAPHFASFAAGMLVTITILHIVPGAIRLGMRVPAYVLAGYLIMYAFDRFLAAYASDKPRVAGYSLGLLPLVGIGTHSLLDGVIYSISFSVNPFTGAVVTLGMILHELPEGMTMYTLLVRSGFASRAAFLLAFFATAFTTPLGMALSYPFISRLDAPVLGSLLALSGGTLLYVGASHLLPWAEGERRSYGAAAFAAGVVIAVGIVLSGG
jgi:zinc transporter ZupT